MKFRKSLFVAAAAIAFTPGLAAAAPGAGPAAHASNPATTAPGSSPTGNGGGYNHMNSPQHATGQPTQSCQTTGTPPGGSASASGSAFNDGGTAGSKYAGSAPQNSRNSASVSQYDVACANQPH